MPESPSKIRDMIGMTEQAVGELQQAISVLEARLEVVLTPNAPTSTSDAMKHPLERSGSQLFGRGQELNTQLLQAVERLRDLAQRVEL